MFFTFLVYSAALSLETLGSYISVVGLASKTGPILISLAIILDFTKIVIASVLYKQWRALHLFLKVILLPVLFILIGVTSTGTYSYIVKEFGKTTSVAENQKAHIASLEEQQQKFEERKKEIDKQIAAVGANMITAKKRLTDMFAEEYKTLTAQINNLNTEIPLAKEELIKMKDDSGTLGSLANTYNVAPEDVIKIIALVIAFMVDPLAIVLLTVANFLVEQRKKQKLEKSPEVSGDNKNPTPSKLFTHLQTNPTLGFYQNNNKAPTFEKIDIVPFIKNVVLNNDIIKLEKIASTKLSLSSNLMDYSIKKVNKEIEKIEYNSFISNLSIIPEKTLKKELGITIESHINLKDVKDFQDNKVITHLETHSFFDNVSINKSEVQKNIQNLIVRNLIEEKQTPHFIKDTINLEPIDIVIDAKISNSKDINIISAQDVIDLIETSHDKSEKKIIKGAFTLANLENRKQENHLEDFNTEPEEQFRELLVDPIYYNYEEDMALWDDDYNFFEDNLAVVDVPIVGFILKETINERF